MFTSHHRTERPMTVTLSTTLSVRVLPSGTSSYNVVLRDSGRIVAMEKAVGTDHVGRAIGRLTNDYR